MKSYFLKSNKKGMGIKCDKYSFGFGNDELIVYHDLTFSIMIESIYCYFNFNKVKPMEFIGQNEDKGKYSRVEFHQIFK
jgi:hypothetical protein